MDIEVKLEEQPNVNDPLYIVLDDDEYNQCASEVVTVTKQIEKFNNKLNSLKKEISIYGRRINLYMSEFYKRYQYTNFSILFTSPTTIELYKAADMQNAVTQQKEKSSEEFFDEEYAMMFGENIPELDGQEVLDGLKQYLPDPLYSNTLTKSQISFLHKLLSQHDNTVKKIEFVSNKLEELQETYQALLDDCIQSLEENSSYNFSSRIHDLILIRDKTDLSWHLLYCLDENSDKVKQLLT